MARRGTPPSVKVAAFRVPRSWPIDGTPQARAGEPDGGPSPEFSRDELAAIVDELSEIFPSASTRRELDRLMADRLNVAKRFHAQTRHAFDHTAARRDINASLVQAAQALGKLNAKLSAVLSVEPPPRFGASMEGKGHVLWPLAANLDELRRWAGAMSREFPAELGWPQLAKAADRARGALLDLDESAGWEMFVRLPGLEEYASDTPSEMLKVICRIHDALERALEGAKPGRAKFRHAAKTVGVLAELLGEHGIPFTHSPYNKAGERVGTPQTPAGRFAWRFLRIADPKMSDAGAMAAIREFVAERNRVRRKRAAHPES